MNTPAAQVRRTRLLLITAHASRAGGGVSVATRDLARIMMRDFDVRVLASADGPTRAEDEPEWAGIDVTTHATIGPRRYAFSPGLLFAVLRARCDLVHVHGLWQFHCLAVLLLRLIRHIPYLVTPHGMLEPWILARSPDTKRMIGRAYQNRFLRRASAIHVLTPQERDDVAAAVGSVPSLIIPNFVERVDLPDRKPAWWEPAFEGRDIFLFLGRIHSKKGCLELCEAWDQLNAHDTGFRDRSIMIFCGTLDDIPDFPARIAASSSRFRNIRYAGPQYGEEKNRSLATATFFCLPSKSEGLPIAVIEAWAYGVPAIMTPECNLPIGFERHAAIKTGVESNAMAGSLAKASALSTVLRQDMAQSARMLVEEHFSPTAAFAAYRALYDRIAPL